MTGEGAQWQAPGGWIFKQCLNSDKQHGFVLLLGYPLGRGPVWLWGIFNSVVVKAGMPLIILKGGAAEREMGFILETAVPMARSRT